MNTLREIWDAVLRNKMRTTATGIAVASGIFLLIVLLGASNGIIHTLDNNSEGLALDVVNLWPGMTTKAYHGMREGRPVKLEASDQTALSDRFAHNVRSASGLVEQSAVAAADAGHVSLNLRGVDEDYGLVKHIPLVRGRFVNRIDQTEQRRSIVIDEKQEETLFGRGTDAVGRSLRIDGAVYTVVGVMETDEGRSNADAYAPLSTLRAIYGRTRHVDQIALRVRDLPDEAANKEFEAGVRQTLAVRHDFDREDEGAVWVWNTAEANAQLSVAKGLLHTAFWVLGLLTLLSGVVGVSNIMLISVKERTHEFGVRKALGARPWSIIRMVMCESVLITLAFGYVGMLLGVVFCEVMDSYAGGQTVDVGLFQQQYFIDPTVDLGTCLEATLVMVVAGALAGFFPARRAAHVKPIEALRG